MRHDGRAGRRENVVAVDMIQMVVRVDHETDRQGREFANLGEQRLGGPWILERVDHQHTVAADYESRVSARQASVVGNRGPDSIADLL